MIVRRVATMRLLGEIISVVVEIVRFVDPSIGRPVHLMRRAAAHDPMIASR
jgi:hypothetical protein